MQSLEDIIEKILKHHSEYDRKDILTMIKEKREELGEDIINDEAAALIVARELGVDLLQDTSQGRFRIEDITEDKRNVALIAKVMRLDPVRTFRRKDGSEGRVASILVGDDTGTIRVVLWDDMTKAISEGHVKIGDILQIRGGYVKKGFRDALELNIGRMGTIRVLEEDELEDFDVELPEPKSTKISDLVEGMYDVTILVKVARVFDVYTFVRKTDNSEGKVRSIIGVDDTGSTRVVFWDEFAEQTEDLEIGEVIRVSGAYTKLSRSGDVEVHCGRSAVIERRVSSDLASLDISSFGGPGAALGLKKIRELEPDMRDVDVEGKIVRMFPAKEWSKDGREGKVQNIMIVDEDLEELRVTFWNEAVDMISDAHEGDVILIEHAYTKERDGVVELQAGRRANVHLNPEGTALADLDVGDIESQPLMIAQPLNINEIDESMDGKSVEIRGIIMTMMQTRPIYLACPKCNKKVTEDNGEYYCSVCGVVKQPDYRFAYSVKVDDGFGTIGVTLFGNTGERLMMMSAKEANDLIEKQSTGEDSEPNAILQNRILGKFVLIRGRVAINRLRNEVEIRANYIEFPDLVEESKKVREKIDELMT